MTLTEVIQKAIEGGYVTGFMYDRLATIDPLNAFELLLLDPQWWICLGKALNWSENLCGYVRCWDRTKKWNGGGDYKGYWCSTHEEVETMPASEKYAHAIMGHLFRGGSIESFFKFYPLTNTKMAQIEDQHYKELSPYFCPRCGKYYSKVRIGIGLHSFYRRYFFCLKGCARNFNLNGEDVTTLVERGEY